MHLNMQHDMHVVIQLPNVYLLFDYTANLQRIYEM